LSLGQFIVNLKMLGIQWEC